MLTARVIWILNTFIVILSYDDLSGNRSAAQYKPESCSVCVATNAVDRNNETCMQTIMGIHSPVQSTWWYVDLGDIHSVYNIRIQFKNYGGNLVNRQRGRFAGFSLYVSNTTDRHSGYLCYKDGPDLPPLDFNTNCITHGRYVIFYNERLRGTIYPMGYELSPVVTELCEVTVSGCLSSDVYGFTCDKPCPANCQENRCDVINGTCLGCTPGWLEVRCDKECPVGYHGLNCESKCVGHCKDIVGCNHTSGLCDNGCDDGWTGSNCTEECPLGTYGPDCLHKCTGKCLDAVACNRTTGKCDTGCDIGYTGELCETGCEIDAFGKGCSYQCSGHCLDNVPCNSTTWHCDSGCDSGYLGPFCNISCEIGTFGKGCSNKCSGHCIHNSPCNPTTGHCDNGCASGYLEPFCNKSCSADAYGMNCRTKCSKGCTGEKCDMNCTTGCKSSFEGPKCDKSNLEPQAANQHFEVVIGAVGASVFLLVIVAFILYVLRQRRNKSKKAEEREETMGFSAMDETSIKSKRKPADKTGIQIDVLKSDMKERRKRLLSKDSQNLIGLTKYLSEVKNTKMEEEYKAISKGELHSCIEGKRQENKSKNRYTTIFPYDHSRVVLSSSTTESDYINANYIADVFGKKTYIATQGPKDRTIADFWRMVWQENARTIICLTNISEAKTKKCAKYWPDLNDKHMEGDISVRCQKEQTYAENVVRHLRIKNNSVR